jgi:hypothetical protein
MLAGAGAFAVAAQASLLVRSFPFSGTSRFYIVMLLPTIIIVLGMWGTAIYRMCRGSSVSWKGTMYRAEAPGALQTAGAGVLPLSKLAKREGTAATIVHTTRQAG